MATCCIPNVASAAAYKPACVRSADRRRPRADSSTPSAAPGSAAGLRRAVRRRWRARGRTRREGVARQAPDRKNPPEMNGHRVTYTIHGFGASTEIERARGRIRHGGIPLMAELSPVAYHDRPFADYLGPLKKTLNSKYPCQARRASEVGNTDRRE